MKLEETLAKIEPVSSSAMEQCIKNWNRIAKPLHSLGRLEDMVTKIAGITGTCQVKIEKKALVIMCGDNGVVEEGVTQSDSEITAIVAENFLDMKSCACIMAKRANAQVFPIDIGIARDTRVTNRKIAYGTNNMTKGPAMTQEQAIKAIEVGIELVSELKEEGYDVIATGEMGIGNTTTSSAIASVLLGIPVEEVTGKGAGLSKAGMCNKIGAIRKAIQMNQPDAKNPIDVLAKVGGYDIAGLVGIYIGGAYHHIPIIVDGFISSIAALIAVRMEPLVQQYIIASHVSGEVAGKLVLEELRIKPCLTCEMCLGEGTGAVALLPLLEMSLAVYSDMSTFEQIDIEAYQPL